MQNSYTRALLGDQTGVQVNMPVDGTDRMKPDKGEQVVAAVGWFPRGRVDKAFYVAKDKLTRYLGVQASLRVDARNETRLQIYEAFVNGAAGAVVSRIKSDDAVDNYVIISNGASAAEVITVGSKPAYGGTWLAAIKPMDCINAGYYVEVRESKRNAGWLAVRIRERSLSDTGVDQADGDILYEFEGSLLPDAVDDIGNSAYIIDVVSKQFTDWIEIDVNTGAEIAATDVFKTAYLGAKAVPYADSGTPTAINKQDACQQLATTGIQYNKIMECLPDITQVQALITLSAEVNRRLYCEVPGTLSPAAAIAWIGNFNYPAQEGMYISWIYSPIARREPTGNGHLIFGTVGQRVGKFLRRNANTNGHGLAPLNEPVSGKNYYLTGTSIKQTTELSNDDRADLADKHIIPVQYEQYHDGGGFVWADCLSGAKKNGISKLETVADMMQWVQHMLGLYSKSVLMLPMKKGLREMDKFCNVMCTRMASSDWLVASPTLNGKSYWYLNAPNEAAPDDVIDTTVALSFDGVVRRIKISTTMLSRG